MSNSQLIKAARKHRRGLSPGHVYPRLPHRPIERIAAITCHFNPCGYERLETNYHRFAADLPEDLDLWTIELAFGDELFRLPDGSRMMRVRGTERHVLWQKERLLNLLIEQLPAEYDAIAWLDADFLWLNPAWVEDAKRRLETHAAVQLFDHVQDLDPDGQSIMRLPGYVHHRKTTGKIGRPGGAWAARRDCLASGLYDRHALGGGDQAMLYAWEGRPEELPSRLNYSPSWLEHYQAWAAEAYAGVQGSLDCVPGDVLHLYHGTRANRQYGERYQIFQEHAYDLSTDVEIDPDTGLLQWTEFALDRKPEMVRRVRDYFWQRREDD